MNASEELGFLIFPIYLNQNKLASFKPAEARILIQLFHLTLIIDKIIIYNSGTSSVRDQEELETCFEDIPGDNRTALFRIDIIEIPIKNPEESKIVSSPTVFADDDNGVNSWALARGRSWR